MQAYSLDSRQRVVSAYENGLETIQEVAERLEVSRSFTKKMLARKRSTGDVKPIGHRGGQQKLNSVQTFSFPEEFTRLKRETISYL